VARSRLNVPHPVLLLQARALRHQLTPAVVATFDTVGLTLDRSPLDRAVEDGEAAESARVLARAARIDDETSREAWREAYAAWAARVRHRLPARPTGQAAVAAKELRDALGPKPGRLWRGAAGGLAAALAALDRWAEALALASWCPDPRPEARALLEEAGALAVKNAAIDAADHASAAAMSGSRRALQGVLGSVRDEWRRATLLGARLPTLSWSVLDDHHAALPPSRPRHQPSESTAVPAASDPVQPGSSDVTAESAAALGASDAVHCESDAVLHESRVVRGE